MQKRRMIGVHGASNWCIAAMGVAKGRDGVIPDREAARKIEQSVN